MEENFYKDEFELFLKEQADNHRMYPSDRVWRTIYKQIHAERHWPALSIAALVLFVTVVAISVRYSYEPNLFTSNQHSKHIVPLTSIAPETTTSTFVLAENISAVNPGQWKKHSYQSPSRQKSEGAAYNTANATSEPINQNAIVATDERVEIKVSNSFVTRVSKAVAVGMVTQDESENIASPLAPAITAELLNTKPITNTSTTHQVNPGLPANATKKKASWKNKFSYQVYLSPTLSYRRLRETSTGKKSGEGPMALNLVANVHQIVRHKPGNGLEAGVAVVYDLTPKVRLKSGFQVNMRQYNIAAFRSPTEVATIALYGNSRVDTINAFANYRTNTGSEDVELTNRYYQMAVPVGLEIELFDAGGLQLNVGATVQPTYQLNTKVFTLATNMKNYTEVEGMLQRWNINSSVEANFSFKAGVYKWQIGPQVRYQHLPSMIPQYPFKEYLIDYGVKLGITKPF